MARHIESYKGLEITIETNEMDEHEGVTTDGHEMGGHHMGSQLTIAGEKIHVMKTKQNLYGSHYLPYTVYPSVSELAKNIIDIIPSFRQKAR